MISIINVSDVLMRLIGLLPPSDIRINHFYDALIEIIIPENLVFVDTKRILCGDGFPNPPMVNYPVRCRIPDEHTAVSWTVPVCVCTIPSFSAWVFSLSELIAGAAYCRVSGNASGFVPGFHGC